MMLHQLFSLIDAPLYPNLFHLIVIFTLPDFFGKGFWNIYMKYFG